MLLVVDSSVIVAFPAGILAAFDRAIELAEQAA